MSRKTDLIEKEELVQAVVLADNFNNAFAPITDDIPLALLPIVNVPLIDYTLECLALGGINEVFLFCCSQVDKIKAYIRDSIAASAEWSLTLSVQIIVSESCQSLGDAMRDLDAKGLIRGDFILLGVNTVSNVKFLPILTRHKKICKKDKGASMTLIYKEALPGQRGRCPQEEVVIASDAGSNKVLFHQKLGQNRHLSKIGISLENLLEYSQVEIHHDLQDTHIAVCSASVLPLFSDNFDFQTCDDLIKGLLNDEILTNTIYWHQITDYAACVTNWFMYQAVSHDIIHRWTFPLVPDMGITKQEQMYMYLRNNVYRNKSVKLSKGSNLVEDVVIAENSTVAEESIITRSVIGTNSKIGKHVEISDSYLMEGCIIGNNVKISLSVLGPHCVLQDGVQISNSCILGSSVCLQKGKSLEDTLVQAQKTSKGTAEDAFGPRAYRVHLQSEHVDDSDSELGNIIKNISRLHRADESSEEESDDDESTISGSEMSHMTSPVPDDTNLFLSEVIDSLARGYDDKLACDNLILEINSSRYAYNVTLKEVNYNVMKAILNLPFQQQKGSQYLQSLHLLLKYFSPILTNYVKNDGAMMDCLQAIQDVANTCSELIQCVAKVLHWFYDQEILSEDSITGWFSNLDSTSRLHAQMKPFINWLEEADEESETDDSE